jgi:hypothetical protein
MGASAGAKSCVKRSSVTAPGRRERSQVSVPSSSAVPARSTASIASRPLDRKGTPIPGARVISARSTLPSRVQDAPGTPSSRSPLMGLASRHSGQGSGTQAPSMHRPSPHSVSKRQPFSELASAQAVAKPSAQSAARMGVDERRRGAGERAGRADMADSQGGGGCSEDESRRARRRAHGRAGWAGRQPGHCASQQWPAQAQGLTRIMEWCGRPKMVESRGVVAPGAAVQAFSAARSSRAQAK